MSGMFHSSAPEIPPVPDRGDVQSADLNVRRRAARTGRSQVLLTAIRDPGNTGKRPTKDTHTLLGG